MLQKQQRSLTFSLKQAESEFARGHISELVFSGVGLQEVLFKGPPAQGSCWGCKKRG